MVKAALAIAGGFVATAAMFGGGAATATWFIAAERGPATELVMDQNELWTPAPKAVETAGRDLQRLAPRQQPAHQATFDRRGTDGSGTADAGAADAIEALPPSAVDPTVTAAIPREEQPPVSQELVFAHLEWCANRYRSYRPRDNSYTPFSGGRRACVSPYTEALQGSAEAVSPPPAVEDSYVDDGPVVDAAYVSAEVSGGAYATRDHLEYCFSRYRSYRPEDNSYQPYGGGPRRQCE